MDKKDEIIKFKFEDIFRCDDIKTINTVIEYIQIIKTLDNKNKDKFILSKEESGKIIEINEEEWRILECNAKLLNKNQNSSRFEISVKLENKKNKDIYRTKRALMRNNYKFLYKDSFYLCFILESLKNYFSKISKEHEFYIEIEEKGEKIFVQPSSFFSMEESNFQIKINYKFNYIELEKLETKNVYEIPEIIKGKDLNRKLGLYTNLKENDYNNFIYFETKERKKFLNGLAGLSGINNIIGLCGPFGTGKTITLLKFLIEYYDNRVFYINLWTIAHISIIYLKDLFKYESIKLFGGNIFNTNEKFCLSKEREIYQKIIYEIDNFVDKKKIFTLLEDIIKYLNEIESQENTYIIIDQYSSRYDDENKLLNHLLDINKKNNIYIIVSSSMNNYDIKRNFSKSLNLDFLFSNESFMNNGRLKYYYIGSLIRLNHLTNFSDLIKNESSEFIKCLNEFGNLPLFYYELKDILKWKGKLKYYMEDEKKRIIEEFELFYQENFKSNSSIKFEDILKILSIINEKVIYFIDELSEQILILPLKFLEIKKEEIKLGDLKVFAVASNNQKILDKIKDIEEEKDDKILSRLIMNDKNTKNFIQFINEDNFCSKYIEPISEKKRKKILDKDSDKYNNKITIYYLDYLFPYMEEIFSDMIYRLLMNTSKLIFNNLPAQSQGGFLEYIINVFVKNHEKFMDLDVQNFETIETLVPNNFFIKNYSSRKIETLKTYTENKNISNNIKRELPKNNIFINQKQFTGKYYDHCILIYDKESDSFILYLFQVSKKKITSNRYYKEEHKIIFNRVKENLEERYSIKIDEGYFSYILVYEDQDKKTIEFCEKNSLKYYLFSVKKLKFISEKLLFDDESLVTKDFPIHSSFSILPKTKFEKDSKGNFKNAKEIKNLERSIKFERITKELKTKINQYFIPKNSKITSDKNELFLAGHFEEMFDVNHCFCIWIDNINLSFIYTDKEKTIYKVKLDNFEKLSNFNYTLLCFKYKIKYIYENN